MTEHYLSEKMKTNGGNLTDAWEGLFGSLEYTSVMNGEAGTEITIDWEDGRESVHSAKQVWDMIFNGNKPWILSANGTIFKYDSKGIIPALLERWYSERKQMQAKLKEAETEEDKAYWDKRQLVKKINLNSLYGAILNEFCRFFDKRIGQSTTLTGRAITLVKQLSMVTLTVFTLVRGLQSRRKLKQAPWSGTKTFAYNYMTVLQTV